MLFLGISGAVWLNVGCAVGQVQIRIYGMKCSKLLSALADVISRYVDFVECSVAEWNKIYISTTSERWAWCGLECWWKG